MKTEQSSSDQSGFTLIELVIVIMILGILSITALPKFVNLASDAKIASLKALAGTLKSAAQMTHLKLLLQGGGATITSNGGNYVMSNGYPHYNDILRASGVCVSTTNCITSPYNFQVIGDWQVWQIGGHLTTPTRPGVRIRMQGDTSDNCYVQYEVANTTSPYDVTLDTSDC